MNDEIRAAYGTKAVPDFNKLSDENQQKVAKWAADFHTFMGLLMKKNGVDYPKWSMLTKAQQKSWCELVYIDYCKEYPPLERGAES